MELRTGLSKPIRKPTKLVKEAVARVRTVLSQNPLGAAIDPTISRREEAYDPKKAAKIA